MTGWVGGGWSQIFVDMSANNRVLFFDAFPIHKSYIGCIEFCYFAMFILLAQ